MSWHTFMINPRRCCMCRRRVWVGRSRYLGMRCHRRCLTAQQQYLDECAPFRIVRR